MEQFRYPISRDQTDRVAEALRYPLWGKAADGSLDEYWSAYVRTQMGVLSESVFSFNSVHDRAMRSETGGIRDGSLMTDEIALRHGLPIGENSSARALGATHHQSFSLDQGLAEWKFGPNYVVVKTRVTNLRILTFFAGESEVKGLARRFARSAVLDSDPIHAKNIRSRILRTDQQNDVSSKAIWR